MDILFRYSPFLNKTSKIFFVTHIIKFYSIKNNQRAYSLTHLKQETLSSNAAINEEALYADLIWFQMMMNRKNISLNTLQLAKLKQPSEANITKELFISKYNTKNKRKYNNDVINEPPACALLTTVEKITLVSFNTLEFAVL